VEKVGIGFIGYETRAFEPLNGRMPPTIPPPRRGGLKFRAVSGGGAVLATG
jgi:hypothetical protein